MKNPSHAENAAWRTAADTVSDLTFDEYRKKLVHETPEIKRFLAETRAEHFIISAPKGFGKTLLLIAKRMQLNEHSPELERGGEMVDRPAGSFDEVSKERIREYKADFDFWRRVWSYSIIVAALNAHTRGRGRVEGVIEDPPLQNVDTYTQLLLRENERFRSPTLVFTSMLGLDYSARQKAINSLSRLNVMLSDVQSQVAFFIDNVDEYFAPALENRSLSHAVRYGVADQQKSNEIWINAQLALVSSAFQIHKVNHHVRVYCTVRREAFLKLQSTPAEYHQILGSTVEIDYSLKDLEIIFRKNVDLMGQDGLFPEAPADDAVARFFGPAAKQLKHKFVDRSENAFAFLLRHTFYRPRDLMTLCSRLALVPVEDRTPTRIKEEVEAESVQLVQAVFTEMKPFFRLPDTEALLPCIRKNILTLAELEVAGQDYLGRIKDKLEQLADDEPQYRHPFCILHQIGMLGWIVADHGERLEDVQRFVKPREVEVGRDTGLPPTERFYLVHPALDRMIFDRVGRDYSRQFHRANIIGSDLPWREPAASVFVIKGDVCGFSRIMDSELYETAAVKLHEWARTACDELDFVEVTGGDSITMIDSSADKLITCMFKLLKRAEGYRERPLCFRFGGSAGPVTFQTVKRRIGGGWEDIQLPLGQALRSSARLEPHAQKGTLLVDESFVQAMGTLPQSIALQELAPADLPSLIYSDDARVFTIQKSTSDPPLRTRLYFIQIETARV